MGIQIERGFFNDLNGALDDIRQHNMWPTTYKAETATAAEVHWHSEEVHAYVMEGQTDFLDVESGVKHDVKAGDKITVPARTLHAEGAVEGGIVYLIAVPMPLGPEDFLKQRKESELDN